MGLLSHGDICDKVIRAEQDFPEGWLEKGQELELQGRPKKGPAGALALQVMLEYGTEPSFKSQAFLDHGDPGS